MRAVPTLLFWLSAAVLAVATAAAGVATDPLTAWRDGEVKVAILEYLGTVTDPAHPDFIPAAERVAVLDNDGTSWCERPTSVPTRFQVALLRSLVAEGRIDADTMPFRAWLADDIDALAVYGWQNAYREMNAAFAGMPVTAFADSARAFLARSRHPRFGVPYTDLYYLPMLELIELLAAQGFQVWVVTGGEQDFARSYLEGVAGIPPERVIGTWTTPVYSEADGAVSMVRGAEQVYNGHEHKAAHIHDRIGRRPVFAVGNSNNDQAMCRFAVTGPRRGLAIWIHHDDGEREYAYDRSTSRIAGLCAEHPDAHELSMARDWDTLFRR